MKRKFFLIILGLQMFACVFAYDALGHRIVADIAYNNLKCGARHKLDKMLEKHGIIYSAIWADDIRSDEKYTYSYNWHFQNLKDGMTKDELNVLLNNPKSEGEHLFYALDSLSKNLKSNKNNMEALKFVVHFTADLFQPMHLGRLADRGGNDVMIKWFGRDIRLHQLWDTQMLEGQKFSYTEYSRYLQDKFAKQKKTIKNQSRTDAIWETYLLRNKIYAYDYTNLRAYNYTYQFNEDLDRQLYRAGIYLAKILNEIY